MQIREISKNKVLSDESRLIMEERERERESHKSECKRLYSVEEREIRELGFRVILVFCLS